MVSKRSKKERERDMKHFHQHPMLTEKKRRNSSKNEIKISAMETLLTMHK